MKIGVTIQSYMIIAVANGYVMGKSPAAPQPYAVWKVDDDGKGVSIGHYFVDREEAEWDFCARAFEWFEDNVNIHMVEDDESDKDDQCEKCKYNTNDYVCHPHCGGCDGKSKFVRKKTLADDLIDRLKQIKADLANATKLVEEMCAELDRLRKERHSDNNNDQRV
ncbi:MAG: hypothetical protein K2N38_13095 [Oscillospiraceae bacterium]|nr:hypothetical protein [Oscillospiraceae bacterium]